MISLCLQSSRASGGLNINSFAQGLIGPLLFELNFSETVAVIWAGCGIGCACAGYMATFEKRHGLRALANSRYAMGWYPNMFMAVLNLLTEGSFGVLACLSGGQALNVVFKDHLSVAGGIVVVGIAAWLVATAGFKYIQWYQKWVFHLPTSCSI